ncbi:MAG: hypothetical protein A2V86_02280 [Deltaproteobacteria bacterium RBG_16_49_23]|nr:MAG: hypothetical protein A2V86_02280 [Deltaproteobacteria bacterium RBG_16_49_23]
MTVSVKDFLSCRMSSNIRMRVNHGGDDIGMPQQFLHRSDVITRLKKVCGKGVAKGMAANLLVNRGPSR